MNCKDCKYLGKKEPDRKIGICRRFVIYENVLTHSDAPGMPFWVPITFQCNCYEEKPGGPFHAEKAPYDPGKWLVVARFFSDIELPHRDDSITVTLRRCPSGHKTISAGLEELQARHLADYLNWHWNENRESV